MDNFLETFPPKNSNGTDEDKVRELENEKNSILKIFNSFARSVEICFLKLELSLFNDD